MILFPSESTVERYIKSHNYIAPGNYTDVKYIDDITKIYRKTQGLNENETLIETPHVRMDKGGNIKGLKTNIKLDKASLEQLKQSIQLQEDVISKFSERAVNNAFVYYFQPFSINYKCFTVHIQTSVDGMASEEHAKMLSHIAVILKTNGFIAKTFAADGDSGYN